MFYLIYKTTNLINGKYYIGCHVTENPRDDYLGSGTALKKSIKKYGKENFSRKTIGIAASEENMIRLESLLVTVADVRNPECYNLIPGGGKPPLHNGYKRSRKTRLRMRKVHLGRRIPPEVRAKIARSMRAALKRKKRG